MRAIPALHLPTLFVVIVLPFSLLAAEKAIVVQQTADPPKIDGDAGDSVWTRCSALSGFVQFDPYNGERSSEETVVKMACDRDHLYVLFECYDSQAHSIAANLTPREGFNLNDYVSLVLDTFRDQRTSYVFSINPRGVQKDEPGDYIWDSAARMSAEGWTGEMRIPFKSIRFPALPRQTWSVNFERYIFRLKEIDYFTAVARDDVFLEKCARLEGLEKIRGGKNLEFFPYTGLRFSESERLSEKRFAGGLDMKYALTSDLNLDLTASPDFSEVESDPFFFQLTPYEVRLNEQRPFFQEGWQYFESGFAGLFYSKRIRDPRIAAKLTGRQGSYTLGLIGAVNEEEGGDGKIGALRIQRDILKYSSVAAMVSGYDNAEFDNINWGFNLNLRLSQKFGLGGTYQVSQNPDRSAKESSNSYATIAYIPDTGLRGAVHFTRIEKHFEPKAGFYGVRDQQSLTFSPGYQLRPTRLGVKQLMLDGSLYFHQSAGGMELGHGVVPLSVALITLNDFGIGLNYTMGESKVQLLDGGRLYWDDRVYAKDQTHFWFGYTGSRFWDFDTGFMYSRKPVYSSDFSRAYDGMEYSQVAILGLQPRSNVHIYMKNEYFVQKRISGERMFEGSITEISLSLQVTRQLYLNTQWQYDSHDERLKLDTVLGYELGMGNRITLSYKSRGETSLHRPVYPDEEMTLLLKASYLFRI